MRNIKPKENKGHNERVPIIHSIGGRIIILSFIVIVLTALIMLILIMPVVQSVIIELDQNYLLDLAETSGETIDNQISTLGEYRALNGMSLQRTVGDVGISGIESSYTYVIDSEGKFLYHPDLDRIGQMVEDEAVEQILAELAADNRPESALLEYDSGGIRKYAAYYVGVQMNHVLIVTAEERELLSRVQNVLLYAIFGAVLAFAISILLALFVARMIVRPIKEIAEQVLRIGLLDFKRDIKLEKLAARKDESGIMAKAVEQLQDQLVNVLKDVKHWSQKLYDAANEMSTSAQKSTDSAHQVDKAVSGIAISTSSQAQDTQIATENVIVMGSMIEQTGTEVSSLKDNIKQMGEHGSYALQILEELEQVNQGTRKAIKEISEQTYQTNRSAADIKKATTLIADIAEETNLLALNASIEAARASEHGRGFAVVAAQIQKLAEQSNESAKQIDSIINLLIHASDHSVATMQEVNGVIDKQNQNIIRTEQAFEMVKQGIDYSMSGIDAIVAHTEKLDQAREKVVDVVQNLTVIARENAENTEQTAASVEEVETIIRDVAKNASYLTEIADRLEECIQMFHVSE